MPRSPYLHHRGGWHTQGTPAPRPGAQPFTGWWRRSFLTLLSMVAGFALGSATISHAQDLFWAKKAGGPSTDEGNGIAVDGSGNSYVTGRFQGTSVFGPGEAGQTSIAAGGLVDIFVAKYDPDGLLVWVKKAGGEGTNEGHAITVDSSGNSYVTGFFQNTATFGPGEGNETTLVAQGGNADVFVAKYNSSGLLQWVKQAGSGNGVVGVGSSTEQGLGIGIDASNVYVTGFFQSTNVVFGPGEAGEVTLSVPGGGREIFLAKFAASDGTFAWVRNAGGVGDDEGHAIAVDSSGNSHITGMFQQTATFGASNVVSSGNNEIFVAKYDTSGTLVWVKRAGGGSSDEGRGIALDSSGKSYVTGWFIGTSVTFGPGEGNQTVLSAGHGNDTDIFVASFNTDGTLAWARRAGGLSGSSGPSVDQGQGIATDSDGNSYVTGYFNNTAAFGATSVTASGVQEDIFVATYTSAGSLIWVRRAGGTDRDESYAVAVRNREAHLTGRIQGPSVIFGLGETNQTTLSTTAADIFVAKYKAPICGDSAIGVGETCDEGANNGQPGSCCSSVCTLLTVGTECRAGNGECDAAEVCNGVSGVCPADGFASPGTACGGSDAACDALDTCNGSGSCIDNIDTAGTVCLSGTGVCDPNDTCDGSSTACAPTVAGAGTACGGSDAACDALDTCNGSGGCVDNIDSATVICRTSQGSCDPAEQCTGNSTICREGSGDCTDTPEFCNGTTGECPPDLPVVATFGCQIGSDPTLVLCQGGPGKDIIVGTDGPDVILGGGGNDELRGQRGDDIICGEEGNDLLVGALGNDILIGGNGKDLIRGNGSDSPLVNEEDNNREFGGPGNDTLIGGEGADRLEGEGDNDRLLGHGANDFLFGGAGKDNLNAGGGDDELDGGTEADKLDGGEHFDKCKNGDGPPSSSFKNCEAVLP